MASELMSPQKSPLYPSPNARGGVYLSVQIDYLLLRASLCVVTLQSIMHYGEYFESN